MVAEVNSEKCVGCKICVPVCPVGAISMKDTVEHLGLNKAFVDPSACINCGVCVNRCPVKAIIMSDEG